LSDKYEQQKINCELMGNLENSYSFLFV